MTAFNQILPVIIYALLIILIVALIIFVVKAFRTLEKIDTTIDDVNSKMSKLNGLFNIVDRSADTINMLTDKMVVAVTSGIAKLFKKKDKEED